MHFLELLITFNSSIMSVRNDVFRERLLRSVYATAFGDECVTKRNVWAFRAKEVSVKDFGVTRRE